MANHEAVPQLAADEILQDGPALGLLIIVLCYLRLAPPWSYIGYGAGGTVFGLSVAPPATMVLEAFGNTFTGNNTAAAVFTGGVNLEIGQIKGAAIAGNQAGVLITRLTNNVITPNGGAAAAPAGEKSRYFGRNRPQVDPQSVRSRKDEVGPRGRLHPEHGHGLDLLDDAQSEAAQAFGSLVGERPPEDAPLDRARELAGRKNSARRAGTAVRQARGGRANA